MFFKITIRIYRTNLFVSVGQTYEDLLTSLKKNRVKIPKDLSPIPETASARTVHFDDGTNLIEVPEVDFDSLDFFESFSHEILHVVFDILNKRGFVLSIESEEAYTYLMGYLTKAVMLKISKLNVPKK